MKMLIGGEWRDSADGATTKVTNPATNQTIEDVPNATQDDVAQALAAATEAFPAWSATPTYERVDRLKRFTRLLLSQQDELAELLARENGKPIKSARAEIEGCARLFEQYAVEALRLYGLHIPGDYQPGYEDDVIYTRRYPYGVMVAIMPFNFAISLFSHKVAPALATGNVVIAKPAEDTPLTTLRISALLHEAGVDPCALQVLTGDGPRIGKALVQDARVQLISFTGSTAVGREVAASGGKQLTPVRLELGGNDPMIICDDADLDAVLEHAFFGRTLENGQCCAASKRFIVAQTVAGDFEDALAERLEHTSCGDPFNEGVEVGPLINSRAALRAEGQIALTTRQGGQIRVGTGKADGAFLAPTMLTGITTDMDVAHDMEIFAPVFPVIRTDSAEEAVRLANASNFGLHAAVFSRDVGKAIKMAHGIDAALVAINGTGLYKPDAIAFGGWKDSGLGREGLTAMAEQYTQVKTIALRNVLADPAR